MRLHCAGLRGWEQGWEPRQGAGQGPVKAIWDRLVSGRSEALSCGARTPDGLQPGTWISSRQALTW